MSGGEFASAAASNDAIALAPGLLPADGRVRRLCCLQAAIVLSVPLWCAIVGGAVLGAVGVRGLLGSEAWPSLRPGGALLGEAPPGVAPSTGELAAQSGLVPPPRLMGLDVVPGGNLEPTHPVRRDKAAAKLALLPDNALERVVGGQAATGSAAASDAGRAAAEEDPQFDALNRVLVEKGGVLLPAWTFEVQPELLYSYKGSNGLLIVERDGLRSVLAHDADIDRLEAAVTTRLGLPWHSQAELRVPYLRASEGISDGLRSNDRSQAGLGDIELALARQFLREDGWLPDLVGEVRWRLPTGEDSFDGGGPATGTGFHGVGGRVTLLKTYDPVVFLGSLAYTANLEGEKEGFDIDPGDTWSLNLAAILAAGPGVSMRTGFGLTFADEAEVEGTKVAGSDRTEAVLSLGAGVTLTPGTLLDVGVGIGVTDDAPDVATRVALAYRF